jgi:large subunit ribosomal protein L9
MEVILLERVEKLGGIGDVVNVKNGFARNYLLPNKKALRANESNRKVFEANRARIESENAEKRSAAQKEAKGVDNKTIKLIRQASNSGQLYGSVSARDIVEALEPDGASVTKSQVVLARPIKSIGMHDVKIALHPEVSVTVHVNVARSPEEAELQAQGIDVIAQMFEEQAAPIAAEAAAATASRRARGVRRRGGEPEAEAEAADPAARRRSPRRSKRRPGAEVSDTGDRREDRRPFLFRVRRARRRSC